MSGMWTEIMLKMARVRVGVRRGEGGDLICLAGAVNGDGTGVIAGEADGYGDGNCNGKKQGVGDKTNNVLGLQRVHGNSVSLVLLLVTAMLLELVITIMKEETMIIMMADSRV